MNTNQLEPIRILVIIITALLAVYPAIKAFITGKISKNTIVVPIITIGVCWGLYSLLSCSSNNENTYRPNIESFDKVDNITICPSCKDTLVVPLGDSANVYCTHCNKTFEVASINTIGGLIFKATGKEFIGKLDSILPINEDRSGYLVNRTVKLGEQAVKIYLSKNHINVKIDTVQLQAIEDSLLKEYSENAFKTMSNIADKMNNEGGK